MLAVGGICASTGGKRQRRLEPSSHPHATNTRRDLSLRFVTPPCVAGAPGFSRAGWRMRKRNEGRNRLAPALFSPKLATWTMFQPGGKPRKATGFCGGNVAELDNHIPHQTHRIARFANRPARALWPSQSTPIRCRGAARRTLRLPIDELPHRLNLLAPRALRIRFLGQLVELEPDLRMQGSAGLLLLAAVLHAQRLQLLQQLPRDPLHLGLLRLRQLRLVVNMIEAPEGFVVEGAALVAGDGTARIGGA